MTELPCSVDIRGRFTLPIAVRDLLFGPLVEQDSKGCLKLYSADIADAKTVELMEGKRGERLRRTMRRRFGRAFLLTPDSQGRVLIPCYMRQRAGIEKGVVIIETDDHRWEIWAEDRLQRYRRDVCA